MSNTNEENPIIPADGTGEIMTAQKIKENEQRKKWDEAVAVRNAAADAGAAEAEAMMPEIQQGIMEAKMDRPKRTVGGVIFTLLLIALVVFGIVRAVTMQHEEIVEEESKLTNVNVERVGTGTIQLTSPVSGRIAIGDDVNIIPMAQGEVTSVSVREDTYVSEGQTLFTIDDTQAQISYQQTLINIRTLEESLEVLRRNLTRTRTLMEAGGATRSDVETIEDNIKTTQLQLENARLTSQSAEQALKHYTVKSTASGYVTQVNVRVGGVAGSSVAVVISDVDHLELEANVSEYLINEISVGQNVDVYVKSVSNDPFTGRITEIQNFPNTNSFTYPIKISINDRSGVIKAGMFAEVRLSSQRRSGVMTIPSDCVIINGDERYVYILESDDTVSRRYITTGLDNGTDAEVTSGLSMGETIVVKGQTYIEDGDTVRVVEAD